MIREAKVIRNKYGEWSHPDLPEWDESVTKEDIKEFENKNRIDLHFVYFEFDAPENLQDEYYSKNFDCINVLKKWNPECSIKPSFLLSIHETEEGPIAIFAIERKERLYIDIIENF